MNSWRADYKLLYPGIDDDSKRKPDTIDDDADHGTAVASAAGGLQFGVVPNANLFLLKMSGYAKTDADIWEVHSSKLAAVAAIGQTFQQLYNNNQPGKAVVTFLRVSYLTKLWVSFGELGLICRSLGLSNLPK